MTNSDTQFLNGILNDNSSASGLTFYQPFKRTNDLADTRTQRAGKKFRQVEDHITPSKEPLDRLVLVAISDLSKAMDHVENLPSRDQVVLNIEDWLGVIGIADEPKNGFKNFLQNEGLTGKLVSAAKRLNSSLSNVDRHILASDGLFFYCAYRAIVGFNVRDIDGIIANMLTSLDKVKIQLNQMLVDLVIKNQNLNSSPETTSELKKRFSERAISYDVGAVIPTIVAEFKLIKEQGDLYKIVDDFVKNNNIKLPPRVNKATFTSKMVAYLAEIGFEPEPDTEAELKDELEEKIATQSQALSNNIVAIDEKHVNELAAVKTDLDKKITDAKTECETKVNENIDPLKVELEKANKEISNLKAKVKKLEASNPETGNFQEELNIVKVRIGNNLEEIEGIGPDYAGKFREKKINTFEDLAAYDPASLKRIFKTVASGYTHKDLIDQAKYIIACDFKKLKNLQDILPRKGTSDVQID